MIGKDKIVTLLGDTLALKLADQGEAVFVGSESGLTRFANSIIHQNVAETQSKVFFRVAMGRKLGVASTNSLSRGDLKAAYRAAIKIAKAQKENPHFESLPGPATYPDVSTFFSETAKFTPRSRGLKVKSIVQVASRRGCTVAGSLTTGTGEVAVVNTRGVAAYQPLTSASLSVIAMTKNSSGYAEGLSRDVGALDVRAVAGAAVDKAVACADPETLSPGEYEVVLEPAAVAALMEWVNYIGFGSKAMLDGTSFMCNRIGQRITGEEISIHDDGTDPAGVAMPFDFEGVPKRRVELITAGVAKGVVYDSLTASRGKTVSTGHALTPDSSGEGALALNLFVAPGDSSLPQMIAGVGDGLLVTRFHYINGFLDTPHAVLTGMTRDGLMRIKDGRLQGGVKNLRFTDSMLRAFGTVKALSAQRQCINAWWDSLGCITAPAVHLGSFRFSGQTGF
ncbi:MAG: TldD/PmbA family protein [Candidatus Zixiibacteriota bacterium]